MAINEKVNQSEQVIVVIRKDPEAVRKLAAQKALKVKAKMEDNDG